MASKLNKLPPALEKALQLLQSLEAGSVWEKYPQVIKQISQKALRVHEVAQGMMPEGEDGLDEEGAEEDNTVEVPEETTQEQATRRIQTIIGNPEVVNLTMLKKITLGSSKGTHAPAEDEALSRLYHGYDIDDMSVVHRMFLNLRPDDEDASWKTHIVTNEGILAGLSGAAVIEPIEEILYNAARADNVSGYITYVIRTIYSLLVAQSYAAKSKTEKGQIIRDLYTTLNPDEARRIEQILSPTEREAALKGARSSFTAKYQRLVTARNHTLRLYHTFGPAVLLDPIWYPGTGLAATRRSRGFGAVMEKLLMFSMDEREDVVEHSSTLLANVLRGLGGPQLTQWVAKQLRQLDSTENEEGQQARFSLAPLATPSEWDPTPSHVASTSSARPSAPLTDYSPTPSPSRAAVGPLSNERCPYPNCRDRIPVHRGKALQAAFDAYEKRPGRGRLLRLCVAIANPTEDTTTDLSGYSADISTIRERLVEHLPMIEEVLSSIAQELADPEDGYTLDVWTAFKARFPRTRWKKLADNALSSFEAMTHPLRHRGYYGHKGYNKIVDTLVEILPRKTWEKKFRVLKYMDVVLWVIAPHALNILISEDQQCSVEEAEEIRHETHIEDDDEEEEEELDSDVSME